MVVTMIVFILKYCDNIHLYLRYAYTFITHFLHYENKGNHAKFNQIKLFKWKIGLSSRT